MNHSESLTNIAKALAAFQANVEGAKKNAQNPHLRNKYADLASIWDAIREPLADNGLSVVQLPAIGEPNTVRLETRLLHVSGEWLASELQMPVQKNDPQGYGSALTYARRYSLAALLGIIQEDDDAEGAMKRDSKPASQPAPAKAPAAAKTISTEQAKRFYTLASEAGLTDAEAKQALKKNFDLDSANAIPVADYETICDKMIPQWGQVKKNHLAKRQAQAS